MRLSIITVTLNSATTVGDTIASVFKQEYTDYEYIIVDGGSEDETVEIIKTYEHRFEQLKTICKENCTPLPTFRWISEKDRGMYDAINKGIRMATGDVVGIINSDDFYHRSDIFTRIAKAMTDGVEAIYGDVRYVKSNNLEKTIRYYSSKNWNTARFRFGFMPAHPSFFERRENFDKYGYYQYDYIIAADYELLIRHLYTHKVKAKYVSLDFLKMRTGGRSTKGLKSNLILNREIVRACKENGIWTCMPLLFLKYFIKVFELIHLR